MNLQWPFLLLASFFACLTVVTILVRRAERESGRALLGWSLFSWRADKYPTLFKLRLASYWLAISFFGLAAFLFFVQFLGIVN